jgi:peptidoglycan/LPS O-acetylase OafA/YrhL
MPMPEAARPRTGGTLRPAEPGRLRGLDGIRAVAALFVVENHIFLRAFPGYPVNHAPWWAAPFLYGRFAVVVFIVLSGFCLAAGPARREWRLTGVAEFARRRAWRILPAYWAALVFSLLMTWFVVAQPGWPTPTGRSVLVNGGLVQDVFLVPSPNRAFWSIAIEAQLYLVFPLLILLVRRTHAAVMLAAVAVPVLYLGTAGSAGNLDAAHVVTQYTPDLAVLFAIGVAAAGLVRHAARAARWWGTVALVLAVPPAVLIRTAGSTWTIDHLFWVDLSLGPAIACVLVAVSTGHAGLLGRVLDSRPLRRLGTVSYSLYLTHAPIVIALYYGVFEGRVDKGVPMFLVLNAVTIPLTVGFAFAFGAVFDVPFQRRRSWAAIRAGASGTPDPRPSPAQPSVASA